MFFWNMILIKKNQFFETTLCRREILGHKNAGLLLVVLLSNNIEGLSSKKLWKNWTGLQLTYDTRRQAGRQAHTHTHTHTHTVWIYFCINAYRLKLFEAWNFEKKQLWITVHFAIAENHNVCRNIWNSGTASSTETIPINCFVSHRPTDPLCFKVPFKENITDPYFWKFQWNKKVFNLKELYYFEIIFWLFFFIQPTGPTFRGGGRWETKHFMGMAREKMSNPNHKPWQFSDLPTFARKKRDYLSPLIL